MLAREKIIEFFDVKTKAMLGISTSFFVPFAFAKKKREDKSTFPY